jgi:hypothetical protein
MSPEPVGDTRKLLGERRQGAAESSVVLSPELLVQLLLVVVPGRLLTAHEWCFAFSASPDLTTPEDELSDELETLRWRRRESNPRKISIGVAVSA